MLVVFWGDFLFAYTSSMLGTDADLSKNRHRLISQGNIFLGSGGGLVSTKLQRL